MTLNLRTRAMVGLPASSAPRGRLEPVVVAHYSTGQERGRTDTDRWWRDIWQYHTGQQLDGRPAPKDAHDWTDIAYHFGIESYGRVLEGRPLDRLGAHAGTTAGNRRIGVCFLGNDDPGVRDVTAEAEAAFVSLLRTLDAHKGQRVTLEGHRDHKSTACPGDELYGLLPALRAAADRGTPAARRTPAAVIWTSDVDREAGRVLARALDLPLIRSIDEPALSLVDFAYLVGQARDLEGRRFPKGTEVLAGATRDQTAAAIGATLLALGAAR